MSGIIEIWRKERHPQQPVRFVVGNPPSLTGGESVADVEVRSIVYREGGTLGKFRFPSALFCVNFVNSPVQRLIPASEVIEIAYETKEADEVKLPGLET